MSRLVFNTFKNKTLMFSLMEKDDHLRLNMRNEKDQETAKYAGKYLLTSTNDLLLSSSESHCEFDKLSVICGFSPLFCSSSHYVVIA